MHLILVMRRSLRFLAMRRFSGLEFLPPICTWLAALILEWDLSFTDLNTILSCIDSFSSKDRWHKKFRIKTDFILQH